MTNTEEAQLLGKVDALEIARKVDKLSDSVPWYGRRRIGDEIRNIMVTTMSILSAHYAELFSEREVREAYYRSFERNMHEVGLVREGFRYAPEGTEFVKAAEQREAVPH